MTKEQAIEAILERYREVATGETRGAFGHFWADGHGTLFAVSIPVEWAEALATACGQPVHPRTKDYRDGK